MILNSYGFAIATKNSRKTVIFDDGLKKDGSWELEVGRW